MSVIWQRRWGLAAVLLSLVAMAARPARGDADQPYSPAAQGNNAFAFDLYSRLKSKDGGDKNLFFSPYSISSALAMTYLGARGQTAQEIIQAMRLPVLPQRQTPSADTERAVFAGSYAALNKLLSGDPKNQGFNLDVANSLWGQKGEPFLPDYLDVVKKDFGGTLTGVDFSQPEAVRQQVNQWVANQTHDKIKDLLPPGTVAPDERLILANAIYFKAAWMHKFDPKSTAKADFSAPQGPVQTDIMHETTRHPYAEDDLCQMVELPYNGGQLSMLVLLPKPTPPGVIEDGKLDRTKAGLHRLESALTSDYLTKLTGQLASQPIKLSLPKWEMTQSVLLGDMLQAMGMRQAFTSNADFSGINGKNDLFLSEVIHKAYVKVDEDGTEAAGATAIMMLGGAMPAPAPPVEFNANRPFIYLIVHQTTGAVLFAGRMCNPTAHE